LNHSIDRNCERMRDRRNACYAYSAHIPARRNVDR
jgi:hypothetical protein